MIPLRSEKNDELHQFYQEREKEPDDQVAPDIYRNFEPHVERVNFDAEVFSKLARTPLTDQDYVNCRIAANDISYQLLRMKKSDGEIREPSYWKRKEFKGLKPWEIEAKIIADHGRPRYGTRTKYGKFCYEHCLMLIKLIFPETDITPVLADITQLVFANFTYKRKYLHLLGSQDSGKSSTAARLIFAFMIIDQEKTFATVASPFMTTAETIIWGDVLELHDQLKTEHPHNANEEKSMQDASTIFPACKLASSKGKISFTKKASGKAGWAAVRNLKKGGVMIGTKGLGSDPRKGVGMFVFDEINRAESTRFRKDLSNVSAQDWFCFISTQNPKDEDDVGGEMASPVKWMNWGVDNYDEVREEQPVIWPTDKSGIAYRLNGMDSVNMRLKKVVYTYQFDQDAEQKLAEEYGRQHPEYYSQCLALFPGADMVPKLLSTARLQASRHDDEHYTFVPGFRWVLFCDPAFTGYGDKAVIGAARFGKAFVTTNSGEQEDAHIIEFQQMESVTYVNNFRWDNLEENSSNLFVQRYHELGLDFDNLTEGSPISYEQQIALRMEETRRKYNIPVQHVGFDFSMRPEIQEAVYLVSGYGAIAYNYKGKPVGRTLMASKEDTAEKCAKRIDEIAFLAADVFRSKQVRGGDNIGPAILQTQRTRINRDKALEYIEDKVDYKARWGGSPDYRDTLFGLIDLASAVGFRTEENLTPEGKRDSVYFQLKKRRKGRKGYKLR